MPLDNPMQGEDEVLTMPANVGANPPDPVVSSEAPPAQESQAATDEASGVPDERAGVVEPAEEPLPEFDPRWKDPFEGMCFLGKLRREFDAFGHRVVIRTMVTDETLECGLLAAPYMGTLGEMKAYQTAVVAGCVVSVDGKPLPIPLTDEDGDSPLANRFHYVKTHWFPPTLDLIYQEYLLLESVVDAVMKNLGEASG